MEGSTDSFSGNEWELSKENVQPLKQGRKMANLTAALAPSSVDQTRIFREKQEFEAQLRTYEGEDPLEIWYRYIIWTSENFPKGGKDLGNLLERCMTTFKDQERYKNDERYAKVWLRYSDMSTNPMDIFNYMHSQQVCSGLALFYESWAQLLESFGDHKKADEVYNLGIHRTAQPVERLIKQHRAFEMRLTERVANGLQEVKLQENSEPERTTLGGLKRQGKKGTVGTKRTGNATLSNKGGISVAAFQTGNTSSGGFKIFCDDYPDAASSLPPSTGEWQMPPTEPVMKKENTQKPGKWTDAKVSQRNQISVPLSGTCMPQKPTFSVHVDDDVVNHPTPAPKQVLQFDKVLSAKKPDKHSVMESLRNKTENAEIQTTRVMYCKEKIYAGTEEFSFEELRAARIFSKIREGTYKPADVKQEQQQNVRYMYPKREVYSFEGEFQYEEILARRYLARRKKYLIAVNQSDSKKSTCASSFVESSRGLPSNEDPCPMDIGSCQKVVVRATGITGYEENNHLTLASQSSEEPVARRGLAFADHYNTPPVQNSSALDERSQFDVPSVPSNVPQFGYGKSAFQPVGYGVQNKPSELMPQVTPGSRPPNISNHHNRENRLQNPSSDSKVGAASVPDTSSVNSMPFPHESITGNKFNVFSRTPDANKSGDLNSSNLTGPSPTVFTKQALMVVRDMFAGPLESERDFNQLDQTDKDFEAAFSNDHTTRTSFAAELGGLGGFGGAGGFVIYDETATNNENKANKENDAEDKENMPPTGSQQEAIRRPLAGILQPSVGIPTCPLETSEDEDDEMIGHNDENDADLFPKSCQPSYHRDKTSEVSLADFTHDQTAFTTGNFAAAARMASTPFCSGIGPSSLPNIPWSTIRPTNENSEMKDLTSDEAEYSSACANAASFASTPSKALSPIFEGSNEDSNSTNSSHLSNGSSRRGSCSTVSQHNGLELSKIQEETSLCQAETLPQETNVGSAVVNPFAGDVVDAFLSRINPPLSAYEGFTVCSREMPKIAANVSVCFGNDDIYHVENLIGSGAFAKVYLASKRPDDETDDEKVVLKVQKISIEWEFYISRQLHSRMQVLGCSKELHEMFMNPLAAYVYSKSSVLLDRYKPLGTILDMVNKYKLNKKSIEEGVMFFYTIALLRILEVSHACQIIHGDVKPDNFLVLDTDEDTPDCAALKLIDFGRSIDMKLFPAGTTFSTNCYTEDFQCIEMKEGRAWTTQVDMYGILGTVHCLLFQDYMKVNKDDKGRWKITKCFRRYWNPIWGRLFDSLLNIPSCEQQPSLRDFREEFEKLYQMDEANYIRQKQRHDRLMF